MTDVSTTLPPALSRALDLLIDPPSEPDVSNGYLDLLGTSVDGDDEAGQERRRYPGGMGVADRVFPLRQRPGADPPVHRRLAAAHRVVEHPGGRRRLGRRRRARFDHHIAGSRRRSLTALRWVSTSPSRCWRARCALRRVRRSAFCGQTRNGLPLRDATVDAAVSIAVLQLIPDPVAALAEIARVLKPGGRLAVMVPTCVRRVRAVAGAAHRRGLCIRRRRNRRHFWRSTASSACGLKPSARFQWVRGKHG